MRLRIGAMALGFIGAISGYFMATLLFGIGGAVLGEFGEFFEGGTSEALAMIVAFLPISMIGLIGAAITLAKPTGAGVLMLISGIIMLIPSIAAITEADWAGPEVILFMPGSIPLVIAGILALIARKEEG